MTPAPITVTARAAVTTTVTSSVAVSAVQAGLRDTWQLVAELVRQHVASVKAPLRVIVVSSDSAPRA